MKPKEVLKFVLPLGLLLFFLFIMGCDWESDGVPESIHDKLTCELGFNGGSIYGCVDYPWPFSDDCSNVDVPALKFDKGSGPGIKTISVGDETYYLANYYVLGQNAFLFYNDPEEGNTQIPNFPPNHLALCYKSEKGTIYNLDYGWDLDMDLVGDSQLTFFDAVPPANSEEVINYLEAKYGLRQDCQDSVGVKSSITQSSILKSMDFTCLAEKQIEFKTAPCSNLNQCETYCSTSGNSNSDFCKQITNLQFKIPQKCENTKDCITYCTQNPAECESYAQQEGCLKEDLHEVATYSAEDESGCPSILTRGYYTDAVCQLPQMSHCSFCVHPNVLWDKEIKGGVEVCGDTIDNDCSADTSDDCNLFKEGCEQSESLSIDNPEEITPETTPVSGEGSAPPVPTSTANTHYNLFDQKFSWIPTEKGGYCCGYNGIQDLGVPREGTELETTSGIESYPGNYVCLNKEMTGSKEGIPEDLCGDDWCWVKASGPAKFQIFTVNLPTAEPFDLVSNSYNWFACNEESSPTLEPPFFEAPVEEGEENTVSYNKIANRFYCYQEGNHYSWAECSGQDDKSANANTIKGRKEGEGLYTLYLPSADPLTGIQYGNPITAIASNSPEFQKFYGEEAFYDFANYQYLEFLVKFVADETGTPIPISELTKNVEFPAQVYLEIYGPEQEDDKNILYLKENVLGYVTNNPFFSDQSWMHVKVPLKEFQGVTKIKISTDEPNLIGVRNIYLSKEGEESLLCSGEDSEKYSSWLSNIDQLQAQNPISGEKLCTELYGSTAWLGKEVTSDSLRCCGNNLQEYYSGPSKETEGKKYGCWNSQPIADKETIMNVEFKINSMEKDLELVYLLTPVSYTISLKGSGFVKANKIDSATIISSWDELDEDPEVIFCLKDTESCVQWKDGSVDISPEVYQSLIQFSSKPQQIKELYYVKADHFDTYSGSYSGEVTLDYVNDKVKLYFMDAHTGKKLGKSFQMGELSSPGLNTVYVLAEYYSITKKENPDKPIENTLNYPCNQAECWYPLPGNPSYTITNLHPNFYELYFVSLNEQGKAEPDYELITPDNSKFDKPGNILAKKVAQQVLFVNPPEESLEATAESEEPGFYGCNAADYVSAQLDQNLPTCSILAGKFCSSSQDQVTPSGERYTTINTWSGESIEQVGYDIIGTEIEETKNYFENLILQLKPQPHLTTERNFTATVLPTRNFVPNAEFKTKGQELPHWETFQGSLVEESEKQQVEKKIQTVNLAQGQLLRSEKIVVPENKELKFSHTGTAKFKIYLYNKNGNQLSILENSIKSFSTIDVSYLVLELSGPGTVKQPFLQLLDDLGSGDYNYQHQDYPDGYDARKSLACCPQNYCWNGYACIEPMNSFADYSKVAEHVSEGRDYRCIDGQWKYLPLKWDWNAYDWGFCSTEKECFVKKDGNPENTLATFLDGKAPICVQSDQYILDHYCEDGNWTSRTKFLAPKLLEVAETDDYILYCDNYRKALLEYDYGVENKLGGEAGYSAGKEVEEGQLLPTETKEAFPLCFEGLNKPEFSGLVEDKDNSCVNNVCVLKFKDGGVFKTAFATTLNQNISSEDSFLITLNIPPEEIKNICNLESEEPFVECDLTKLSNVPGSLWYSKKLNAVIYSKEGISLDPSLWKKITDWFKDLFGMESELSESTKFVEQAKNFRDLYLLKKDIKQVRALKELFTDKKMLIAEYENFQTPICDYVNVYKELPPLPELDVEMLESLSQMEKLSCISNGTKQKIEITGEPDALDFFWPQLTGKLRMMGME